MNEQMQTAEWLQERHGEGQVIFGSRASGLLHSYLLALGRPGTGVVIPAITCHALPQVIELAEYQPVFADADGANFLMTPETLNASLLQAEVPVSTVIAVHTFGHLADIKAISALCQEHGLNVIEDACQILSGDSRNSHSDAVLFSFGHSKPVDIGGGGALLIRDPLLARAQASRQSELEAHGQASKADADAFSHDYYAIRKHENTIPGSRRQVPELAQRYSTLALNGSSEANWKQLPSGLSRLSDWSDTRTRRAEQLIKFLPHDSLDIPSLPQGSSPWRFTFLVKDPDQRDPLVAALRAHVRHASTWYPSLALDYGADPALTPIANDFEKRAINLWLAEGVDDAYIQASIETIERFFQR